MSFAILELYISNATGYAIAPEMQVATVILIKEYWSARNSCPFLILSTRLLNTTLGSGTKTGLAFCEQTNQIAMILPNNSNLFINVFTSSPHFFALKSNFYWVLIKSFSLPLSIFARHSGHPFVFPRSLTKPHSEQT